MEYTCEVVAALTVESRGLSVTLDVTKLGATLFTRAALHGLKQKIADAAAGNGAGPRGRATQKADSRCQSAGSTRKKTYLA